MSYAFDSRLGEQLYRLLPEVYRTRDKTAGKVGGGSGTEDLARYLDAHGHLLDLIHATLEQQLRDALPESSQDWLLPYFAQLLAANIVSPDSDGRHAEIAHAVSWRQRKGTLKCAEEIAEAVGQMEVEFQEGWKRVAVTPRIGMPLMPTKVWDDTLDIDMTVPSEAVRHPTLPAAMVDLRRPSRAVEALSTNPAARLASFGGVKQTWRQQNRHGVPCFPGSFDDVSRRTVDFRTPNSGKGHYHHKRLLAYSQPPAGLFPYDPLIRTWDEALQENFVEVKHESDVLVYSNRTERILVIHKSTEGVLNDNKVELEAGKNYRIENIHFSGTLLLTKGQLELHRVEAEKVQVDAFSTDDPVLTAENCLFNKLSVGNGIAKLDSCTVREMAYLKDVDLIDSILIQISDSEISGTIQYSRIPASIIKNSDNKTVEDCISDDPVFFENQRDLAARAVLSPNAPASVFEGASDRGEMGYYHRGRRNRPVHITADTSFSLPADGGYPLEDIIFEDEIIVTAGQLVLTRSAAPALIVATPLNESGQAIPSLSATDCLFDNLSVSLGLARLEYCTVMKNAVCKYLQASDCIFIGNVTDGAGNKPESGCIRYSRIPEGFDGSTLNVHTGRTGTNTRETPVFIKFDYCNGGTFEHRMAVFGEPGYGVLHSVTPDAIRFGAEDGGEMGAYHHKHYSLKVEAVLDKMREFLPVGIEPVLIQDTRLLRVPPKHMNSKKSTDKGEES